MRLALSLLLPLSLMACGKEEPPVDQDGDGFAEDVDCNDADPAIHPDAEEVCDGVDNNCDQVADTDATDILTWYGDTDGDLAGNAAVHVDACAAPAGFVANSGDCDDSDAAFHPGATEDDCTDPHDYNCDGAVGFADTDADGTPACEDCDDNDAAAHPGGVEICDDIDNDCDGDVDGEDATDKTEWFGDRDLDGFGDADLSVTTCDAPTGFVANNTDCDDADDEINPDVTEVCDGVDNDCDALTDEGVLSTFYADADSDTFGDHAVSTTACAAPAGYVSTSTDCDDAQAAAYPGAAETCDGIDNDCNDTIDEGVKLTFYTDGDADGFGLAGSSTEACALPEGYAAVDSDCDDTNATVYPGAPELCDSLDNDCDTEVDDNSLLTFYADADADGYGTSATTAACEVPAGYAALTGDCDDANAVVNPGYAEVCDGLDNDCDALTDEGVLLSFYADADSDTYGNPAIATQACAAPASYVSDNTDCDDIVTAVNPSAMETCDTTDNDCDGLVDDADPGLNTATGTHFYRDFDGDTYGDLDDSVLTCAAPAGYLAEHTDCDDTDEDIHPGAAEVYYDDVDQDCVAANDNDKDGDGHAARAKGGDDNVDTNADCWDDCGLGTNIYEPAFDCAEVLTDDATAESGLYWIDAGGATPWQTACDMDLDGGGWTLAAYAGDRAAGFPAMDSEVGSFNAAVRSGIASKGALGLARASTEMMLAYHATFNYTGSLSTYSDAVSFVIPNPSVVTLSTAANQGTCTAVAARRHLPVGSNRVCVGKSSPDTVADASVNCSTSTNPAGVWSQSLGGTYSAVGFGYGLFEAGAANCNIWPAISHHWYVNPSNFTKNWQPSATTTFSTPADGSTSIWFR